MLDILSTCRRLPALLLLLAVLILPLNSLARDLTSVPSQDSCACQLVLADSPADNSEGRPDRPHNSAPGDSCDSEERSLDAADTFVSCLDLVISANRLFHPNTGSYLPMVYLSIFVPPES